MGSELRKIVLFDMDGTLIKENCWAMLHKHFGVDWVKTARNIEGHVKDEFGFDELVRREISIWKREGRLPNIKEVTEVLKNYTLAKNAKATVQRLKDEGFKTALVSYGIDILAHMVGKDLGIDHIYANTLETDAQGYLTGNQYNRVELGNKHAILKELTQKLKIPLSEFVAVGDTKYDISMFKGVGLGVAFNTHDEVLLRAADAVIKSNDLSEILNIAL